MLENLSIMNNFFWAMPEIFLSIVTIILIAYGIIYSKQGGIYSQQKKITWLSIISLGITFIITLEEKSIMESMNIDYISISAGLLGVDSLILWIKLVILMSAIFVLLLSLDYYAQEKLVDYEYSQLILLSTLGMLILVSSKDLVMLYLGIELLSLSLYILATINRTGQYSTEAGLKYFLLGALSSGLLLFGCALIYVLTGETTFTGLSYFIWYHNVDSGILVGAMFIIIALLFKLAAAPFHMWAPDVYEGSPTIVTAYFAIVPKIATLGILIALLLGPFLGILQELQPLILIPAMLSLIVGSLGALNQTKIKRLLAYSAIGHMGFMLIGVGGGSIYSIQATMIYIFLYIIMSINSFAFVLSMFSGASNYIAELSGLSRKNPVLAISFALCLLSIAGIPPLAGFFSKYLILLSAMENGMYLVALTGVLASMISCFYYLTIIKWMYFKDSSDYYLKDLGDVALGIKSAEKIGLVKSLILGMTLFIILTFLLYPNWLLVIISDSVIHSLI